MCVDFGDYHKYLNQIWYRTQMPHSHNLKIQDGGGRHFEFWKNDNYSGLDKDICTKFYVKMHRGHEQTAMILLCRLVLSHILPH